MKIDYVLLLLKLSGITGGPCIILIAFPLQPWLQEHTSKFSCTYVAGLVEHVSKLYLFHSWIFFFFFVFMIRRKTSGLWTICLKCQIIKISELVDITLKDFCCINVTKYIIIKRRFSSSGMWHCVTHYIVPDISSIILSSSPGSHSQRRTALPETLILWSYAPSAEAECSSKTLVSITTQCQEPGDQNVNLYQQ